MRIAPDDDRDVSGPKAGVCRDFATGQCGDALDLVRIVLGLDMARALDWSLRRLGLAGGEAELPPQIKPDTPVRVPDDPDRWRRPWRAATPIVGTRAEDYFAGCGLRSADPAGRVLRYSPCRYRRHPDTGQMHSEGVTCQAGDTARAPFATLTVTGRQKIDDEPVDAVHEPLRDIAHIERNHGAPPLVPSRYGRFYPQGNRRLSASQYRPASFTRSAAPKGI